MDSGTLHAAAVVGVIPAPRRPREYLPPPASTADEPVAVVVAGAATSAKSDLVRALVGAVAPPADSYLVVGYGEGGPACAHVPGCREPQPYLPEQAAALRRPPRRVALSLHHPLLRQLTLVEAPCVHRLGVAGVRILAEAAERGGAVLFAVEPDRPLVRAELDLLAELAARQVAIFFAMPPARSGAVAVPDDHLAAVTRAEPRLAGAVWVSADPAAGDTGFLRQALTEWAGIEGLRRSGPGAAAPGVVRIGGDAAESGWSPALDAWLDRTGSQARHRLAIEVADIHLRCVHSLAAETGVAALAAVLDRELHALSLRVTAEADAVVDAVVAETLGLVLGEVAAETAAGPAARGPADADRTPQEWRDGVHRRVAAAVRQGLGDDPASGELARVLLVTSTGGVATAPGQEALDALAAYPARRAAILPPVGVALSGGCYQMWRCAGPADASRARAWLQRVTRAVEAELVRETSRRFEAVHRSLGGLVAESVDHGILLA
jgi:hypothetical protein